MKTKLAALAPTFTSEGKELTFKEFLDETSGSGELYLSYIGEMLEAAIDPEVGWHDVVDLISPIADQVISASVEVDRESYVELMVALKTTWDKLRVYEEAECAEQCKDREIIINEDVPDVLHVVEGLIHRLREGMVIKDAIFISAANIRLVVGDGNQHEAALIECIRSLEFDDLLDASNALLCEADQQQLLAISSQENLDRIGAKGFRKRAENLRNLAEVLSIANEDYRDHVDPAE